MTKLSSGYAVGFNLETSVWKSGQFVKIQLQRYQHPALSKPDIYSVRNEGEEEQEIDSKTFYETAQKLIYS